MNESAKTWDGEDGGRRRAVVDARDREAFRQLFDHYYPRVFVFVQRRLEDRELAREVTSDVFLDVWVNAGSFRGESKITSWIFGIARFKCLEAIRSRSRLKRARVISTNDEVILQVPNDHAPTTQLDAREELRRVAAIMQQIPREQREALEWTVVGGHSIDEVARRQKISPDTVKTRVSRARRAMRRLLANPATPSDDGRKE